MNPLQRALIEKAGHDNGFEHVLTSDEQGVLMASARHPNRVGVRLDQGLYQVHFQAASPSLLPTLQRGFVPMIAETGGFQVDGEAALASLLRRAASLSRALPYQAVNDYQQAIAAALVELPAHLAGTEMERLVRQRVGQNRFRDALLDYWGGACAVTGVAIPAVLRASHAKPWAECASDGERLDVFNGFLLSAHLDALFDRFLISFDEQGVLLIAPSLAEPDLLSLGIAPGMTLRWLDTAHHPYLAWHRQRHHLVRAIA